MKLLCIDASHGKGTSNFENWIVEGEIYTLRSTTGSLVNEQGVLLKEIKNPPVYIQELAGRVEPSFARKRFVEVDDAMNIKEKESNVEVKEGSLILN
jgi:hypothetical protein